MSFNYNEELLDLLLKQVLGTRYTSSDLVFGQEQAVMQRHQTDLVYANVLTDMTEGSFEWSVAVDVSGGGTMKTLNEVFGEVKPESFKFIKKYENIPMVDISGTNGRGWYPIHPEMREVLKNAILGKMNFTFEIETDIQYDEKINSNNPNYKPIINSGILLFMGNLIPSTTNMVKLKRVYIFDGVYGAINGISLDDLGDVLTTDPSNNQPLVYNGNVSLWDEGSIDIKYMPIQILGDFLEINDEFQDINSGIFFSSETNKWEMENLPTLISDMSNVYFSEEDTNWDGVRWDIDNSGNGRWINKQMQPPLTSINDLPDVDTASSLLINNDGILYDTSYNKWMPNEIQLAMNIGSPDDVNLTNIADNHRLIYSAYHDDWSTIVMGPLVNILSDIGNIDMTNLEDMKPVWTYHSRKELETPIENSYYGNSVDSIINFSIIGAYKELYDSSPPLVNCGKAYIYKSDLSGNWTLYQTLISSDKTGGSLFGSIVKIDTYKAVVSSPGHSYTTNTTYVEAGKVYIYNYENSVYGSIIGSVYTESKTLVSSDAQSGDNFGASLDLYGNYIIVGATQTGVTDGKGKCYIYKKSGEDWNEIKKLEPPTSGDFVGGIDEEYGDMVAISDEFAFVGVSKWGDDEGVVHVYKKNELGNDNFALVSSLTPSSHNINDRFGKSIAVSNTHLFISSPSTDLSGVIYYYNYNSSTDSWGDNGNETNMIKPLDGSGNDNFGISISTTNNYMIAGANFVDICGNDSGCVYMYRNTTLGYWEQMDKIASSDISSNDEFGNTVNIFNKRVFIGSWKNGNPNNSGTVYIYDLPEMEGGTKLIMYDTDYGRWKAGEITTEGDNIIIVTRLGHMKDVDLELPNYPLMSNSTLIFQSGLRKWVPGIPNASMSSIGDIPNVNITNAVNNHILRYTGNENWESQLLDDPLDEIDDILDVEANNPTSGDGLVYNSETNKWEGRMVNKSLATGIYTSATEPIGTEGNLYYDTSVDVYFGKIEDDWLQVLLNNSPIIFGHPTNAITKMEKTITSTSFVISWNNPPQTDTMFESIHPEDKVDGIFYLPTINDIYFEIKKSDVSFNEMDGVLIGGQEKGQKLYDSSGVYMLTNKIIITKTNDGVNIIERDGNKQVYKMNNYIIEEGVSYKGRLWLRNSMPSENNYKLFENMILI